MKKTIIHLALVLFLVSAIVALALGFVDHLTAPNIAKIAEEKLNTAMSEVLPATAYAPVEYSGDDASINEIYKADDLGYVVKATVSGSQGNIGIIVGINNDLTCSGISIVESSETSGMGAIASSTGKDGQTFREQFVGASAPAVDKDGGEIAAITGATITSRAVCTAVNNAIDAVKSLG